MERIDPWDFPTSRSLRKKPMRGRRGGPSHPRRHCRPPTKGSGNRPTIEAQQSQEDLNYLVRKGLI